MYIVYESWLVRYALEELKITQLVSTVELNQWTIRKKSQAKFYDDSKDARGWIDYPVQYSTPF